MKCECDPARSVNSLSFQRRISSGRLSFMAYFKFTAADGWALSQGNRSKDFADYFRLSDTMNSVAQKSGRPFQTGPVQ
jgi:hypothetical protein